MRGITLYSASKGPHATRTCSHTLEYAAFLSRGPRDASTLGWNQFKNYIIIARAIVPRDIYIYIYEMSLYDVIIWYQYINHHSACLRANGSFYILRMVKGWAGPYWANRLPSKVVFLDSRFRQDSHERSGQSQHWLCSRRQPPTHLCSDTTGECITIGLTVCINGHDHHTIEYSYCSIFYRFHI